jgi:hypothetical protein
MAEVQDWAVTSGQNGERDSDLYFRAEIVANGTNCDLLLCNDSAPAVTIARDDM